MAVLLDARGNEYQGSLDSIGGLTLTDGRAAGASLGALNAELLVDIQGKAVVMFELRSAASVATFVFEASLDGTNYFAVPARQLYGLVGATVVSEALVVSVTTAASIGATYMVSASGWRRLRVRCSAYTSGSVTATARGSAADYAIIAQPQPALLNQSIAPAVNTGGTITLPAVAGMFHYITSIQATLAMNPATAQTGGATLFITTTNLPNTPAWVCPIAGNAAASTGGLSAAHAKLIEQSFPNPLKSSVANTNTTIVFPAPGAACVLRANCQYYLGA